MLPSVTGRGGRTRCTAEARREATRDGAPAIDLIDGEALCALLRERELGVRVRRVCWRGQGAAARQLPTRGGGPEAGHRGRSFLLDPDRGVRALPNVRRRLPHSSGQDRPVMPMRGCARQGDVDARQSPDGPRPRGRSGSGYPIGCVCHGKSAWHIFQFPLRAHRLFLSHGKRSCRSEGRISSLRLFRHCRYLRFQR